MPHHFCVMRSIGLLALLTTGVACGGGGDGAGSNGGGDKLEIGPTTIYTGFDGTNTYKAPIIAMTSAASAWTGGKVTWTFGDPSLVAAAPNDTGTQVMLTTKKAGMTTVTASADGQTATAQLVITAYTTAQHTAGMDRYTKSQGSDPPCSSCHATGPDHTPTQIVVDTDDQVMGSFVNGVDPEGKAIPAAKHTWTVTEPQKLGLISYLRSLEPKGYPDPADL